MSGSKSDVDRCVANYAEQYGFSRAAVQHLLDALSSGGGDMAMFNHPEFGGAGQWMRGGLIMIADASDHALKSRIDTLCNALSEMCHESRANHAPAWTISQFAHEPWWPTALGEPSASGAQNDLAYAYFDGARRLAIRQGGQVAVYDTGEYRINGVAQSQHGSTSSLTFTTPLGDVSLGSLAQLDLVEDKAVSENQAHAIGQCREWRQCRDSRCDRAIGRSSRQGMADSRRVRGEEKGLAPASLNQGF